MRALPLGFAHLTANDLGGRRPRLLPSVTSLQEAVTNVITAVITVFNSFGILKHPPAEEGYVAGPLLIRHDQVAQRRIGIDHEPAGKIRFAAF